MYAGTPLVEGLKATIPIAASHSPEFSLMHVDVSRAYFHAKAQRLVPVKLPVEDCSGRDRGEIGLLKKSMHGARDAASNWERDWQGHLEKLEIRARAQFKKSVSHHNKTRDISGLTHGDDFVVTGSNGSLLELMKQLVSVVYPIKASIIGAGSAKSIKALNRRMCWREREGYCINTIPDTLMFSWRAWCSRMEPQCKLQ